MEQNCNDNSQNKKIIADKILFIDGTFIVAYDCVTRKHGYCGYANTKLTRKFHIPYTNVKYTEELTDG